MNLSRRHSGSQAIWPVVLLVSVAALAPTACVLWFMNQAVRNERLAVRQRLAEVYRGQLAAAQGELLKYWKGKIARLTPPSSTQKPGELFAELVAAGAAESVVIYDEENRPAYPKVLAPQDVASDAGRVTQPYELAADLLEQIALELEETSPADAAAEYAELARTTTNPAIAASALLGQARSLARTGQPAAAYGVLTGPLSDAKYKDARDTQGRLIQAQGLLQALSLPGAKQQSGYGSVLQRLTNLAGDYAIDIPAPQRRFLMHELQALAPETRFPTLAAEDLAAEYLERDPLPVGVRAMNLTPDGRFWRLLAGDGEVIALWTKANGDAGMLDMLRQAVALPDVEIALQPAGARAAFMSLPAGPPLPDHELALFLTGADPFAAAARRQVLVYAWTAGIGVLVIIIAGALLARVLARQMRLAQLKNDLVATVSHELKTPLASMRVLIDTLAEGRCRSETQVQDYYRLIASENERLTRLIDNFLTFSRMERKKRSFEFRTLDPAEIVEAAAACVHERFSGPDCELQVDIASDLPPVNGERDALITVLLNLLDNAYKYSEPPRRVRLRAYSDGGQVCVEVRDNGIGLSRRAQRRVFDCFYQVDQTLARRAGGCGLGLSIVKFIVDAHSGTVDVASELGQGSTFTVRLPAAQTPCATAL